MCFFYPLFQGTVNWISTTCLVTSNQSTISGLRLVWVIASGNLSCFLRSAGISQSFAVDSTPLLFISVAVLSPDHSFIRNWMKHGPLQSCRGFTPAASWVKIWSVVSPSKLPIHQTWPALGEDTLTVSWLSTECATGARYLPPPCMDVWWNR